MKKIWIVTHPTLESQLVDILFQASARDLELQFKGGLQGSEIVGFYSTKYEALKVAKKLLKNRTSIAVFDPLKFMRELQF